QRSLQTLALRAETHPDLAVMPLFTNFADGAWQAERLRSLMKSPELARHFADQVTRYLIENGFHGLTLRLSGLTVADRTAHLDFLEILSPALSSSDLRLQHVVNIEGGPLNPDLFAHLVDILIIEAHGQTSIIEAPGPLAAQTWFETYVSQWTERF